MIKLISAIIVFVGCGYLGVISAGKFKKRVCQLRELQVAIIQLEYDIDFSGITLSESFERIAKNTNTELKNVFMYIADRLRNSPGSDMQRVWVRALNKFSSGLALTNDDLEILTDFSKLLGMGNCEKEKNNIRLTEMRLKIAEDEARNIASKNVKVYRGLGFMCGIFIIIILI